MPITQKKGYKEQEWSLIGKVMNWPNGVGYVFYFALRPQHCNNSLHLFKTGRISMGELSTQICTALLVSCWRSVHFLQRHGEVFKVGMLFFNSQLYYCGLNV